MKKFSLKLLRGFQLGLIFIFFQACTEKPISPTFHANGKPEKLSEWNLFSTQKETLELNQGVVPYSLNASLFTDYAHKLRTITVPEGEAATVNDDGTLNFPIGTIISKTFYYPKSGTGLVSLKTQTSSLKNINKQQYQLIETRLLVKRESGWQAFPYIWNQQQSDAKLQRFGEIITLEGVTPNSEQAVTFNYVVPNVNQCAACHQWDMEKELQPIGPQVRHLNGKRNLGNKQFNQLQELAKNGIVTLNSDLNVLPANAIAQDTTQDINHRARAYLDINCSHCHNPNGPANTSGLHLEAFREFGKEVGECKLPIAAGAGTGNRPFDIFPGKPDQSIFSYRLASTEADKMMPELGRALQHKEGVKLIDLWISQLESNCK